jgi:5'-3' exonuclease
MGVPSLFAWWVEHYAKKILLSAVPIKGRRILYLDFNGLIHPAVRNDNLEFAEMLNSVVKYLEKVFNYVKPDELYIAIDGVAPAAKMKQQQDRRYKSAKESKIMRDIAIKYNKPVREVEVDFNMISPGTQFMYDLQEHLKSFLKVKCSQGNEWQNIKVTLDDSNNPGEGEHKIMEHIRSKDSLQLNEQILIYGLDADLIFLSLLNLKSNSNLYLLRENVQFKNRDKTDYFDTEKYPFIYLNIQELQSIILKTLNPKTHIDELVKMGFKNDIIDNEDISHLCKKFTWFKDTKKDNERLIVDYVFICFFLGNDFLPNLPCLKIKNGSLNEILIIYKKVSWLTGSFLISDDGTDFNKKFLKEFLMEIAFIEADLLMQLEEKRQKDIRQFSFRLKNISPMDAEIERFRYVEDQYKDEIHVDRDNWQQRYYEHMHGFKSCNFKESKKQINLICQDYLNGLLWILYYYQGKPCEWGWSYSYHAAPTAHDLADYFSNLSLNLTLTLTSLTAQDKSHAKFKGKFKVKYPSQDAGPVSPFVQLMSVLPPSSADLLPSCLAYYMTNRMSFIHYMYPVKVGIQMLNHKWYHECKALIPFMDRTLLSSVIDKHEGDFTDTEKMRNLNLNVKHEWNV